MTELIIIKTNKSQKLKNFLDKENFSYKVYQEPNKQKIDIFTNYGQVIKNKEREKELKLWDNVDLDEKLNQDDEWWK
ncbi:MAG: hypothetical protein I3273_08015 [Candidatus Moeniiplasma glomeromycotorum]|nr:hypothetical protein [Candidatus Moeniiplasma glomeromycotorum]MCE8168235.1 hypothetical protein [Candidatus Moeniiplasma glomeromycotorum]MCE8170022.1 hypothetical protein [Candidatus Moeniiplasma glomeromycotorum]